MKYIIVALMLVGSLYAEVKKEYYENKQLKSETSYKNGLKHGEENHYTEDGRIDSSTLYKHGEKHGIDKSYMYVGNGRTIFEYKYKDGEKLPGSKIKDYYESGEIRSIIHYRDEELKDTEEEYYENGNLKRKVVYGDKGKRLYDHQKILSEIMYQNIKKVGPNGHKNALKHYKEAIRISRSNEYYTIENQKLIAENYEKACDLNHAESCTKLGQALNDQRVFGLTIKGSYKTSLHRKACDLGSGEGCYWLAWSYYDVGYNKVKDMPKTIKYYEKSCDLGYHIGCANLANTYRRGEDVPADGFKANKYYKKACNLNHNSNSCEISKILTNKGYN